MNRNIATLITISLIGITRSNAHDIFTSVRQKLSDNEKGAPINSECKQDCDCKTGLVCAKEGNKATCKEPKGVNLPKANCSK